MNGVKPAKYWEGSEVEPSLVPLGWAILRCPGLPAATAYDDRRLAETPPQAFLAALEVASPTLSSAVGTYAVGSKMFRRKIRRYIRRMATRTTPFGLFSGVGIVGWAERTDVRTKGAPIRAQTAMSSEFLDRLRRDCESTVDILRDLRVRPNPLTYSICDRLWVWAGPGHEIGEYSIRRIPLIEEIFTACADDMTVGEIFDRLTGNFPKLTEERFLRSIAALLDQSFLISTLYPQYASRRAEEEMIAELSRIPAASGLVASLREFRMAMRDFDAKPLLSSSDVVRLRGIALEIVPDLTGEPLKVDGLLDLAGAHVSRLVMDEAAALANLLLRLNPRPKRPAWYDQVKAKFVNRYGVHRDVPIDIVMRQHSQFDFVPNSEPRFNKRDIAVLKLASAALAKGERVIELSEALITRLSETMEGEPSYPTSCEVAVTLCAVDEAAIDRGDFRLLLSPLAGTLQAGRMSGRFLEMLDVGDPQKLREACRAEEETLLRRGRIRAEIVYSPKRVKLQNVMGHPQGWSHSILLNANARIDAQAIDVADLRIGVRDGELAVVWTRTGQIVEISSLQMLSSIEGSRIVRFLSEIGGWQSGPMGGFDWGLAETFPRLPRIVAGRTILRPAQWRLDASVEASGEGITAWREDFQIPRYVYLVAKDHRLLLDLDDSEHLDELIADLAGLDRGMALYLQECLPDARDAWVEGPDGRLFAELTVPLQSRGLAVQQKVRPQSLPSYDESDRDKSLASEWVYIALYSEWHLLDWLISEGLDALVRMLGGAPRYFYIRYSDPSPHLRLRIWRGGDESDSVATLLARWADGLVEAGLCTDHAFFRYERELERYGGTEAMMLAEDIFAADSRLCHSLVAARNGKRVALDSWSLCVLSLDRLLVALGMGEDEIAAWLAETPGDRRMLGAHFRERKRDLRIILSGGHALSDPTEAAINEAVEAISVAWDKLAGLYTNGKLGADPAQLRRHFAHLHVNRQLGTNPEVEKTIFSLLARARRSLLQHPKT